MTREEARTISKRAWLPDHDEIVAMMLAGMKPRCVRKTAGGKRCLVESSAMLCDEHIAEEGGAFLAVALKLWVKWYWDKTTDAAVNRMVSPLDMPSYPSTTPEAEAAWSAASLGRKLFGP